MHFYSNPNFKIIFKEHITIVHILQNISMIIHYKTPLYVKTALLYIFHIIDTQKYNILNFLCKYKNNFIYKNIHRLLKISK